MFIPMLYFAAVTVITADIVGYLLVMFHLININYCTAVLSNFSPTLFLHLMMKYLDIFFANISLLLHEIIEFVI